MRQNDGVVYDLKMTPAALEDMDGTAAYIACDLTAPESAYNWLVRIEKACDSLRTFPLRAPLLKGLTIAPYSIRMLVVGNHCVFYSVDEVNRIVTIRRVLYGKRNYTALL